ncbi:30S ribosomal protein S8 [Candidatus Tiddalikarchaeum anstoanum]|nr:30S ribosomal protein S8 [Candidatus Tiddalikarchaeum anstoanum]
MRHDLLADALSVINNAEKAGKTSCTITPVSKFVRQVLDIFKKEGYITGYEYTDNKRGGVIVVQLAGKINKTGSVKPRFSSKKDELEKFEKRYLPSKDFGFIIISTPKGLITHIEAEEKQTGGKIIAYVY